MMRPGCGDASPRDERREIPLARLVRPHAPYGSDIRFRSGRGREMERMNQGPDTPMTMPDEEFGGMPEERAPRRPEARKPAARKPAARRKTAPKARTRARSKARPKARKTARKAS